MISRIFYVLIFILLGFGCNLNISEKNFKPNIIFIMSDDHTCGAISAYGDSFVETPNIDRLADSGMRFTNAFNVVSLCGPSRASILSGKYSILNGTLRNYDMFDRNQVTFPKLLQHAGYETAIIGKWHLMSQPAGFDFYDVISGQGSYFNCRMKDNEMDWQDGGKGGQPQPGYVTNVITDKAINWLKNRKEDSPFCLMVHHKAPHEPYQYPEQYEKILAGKKLPIPDTFNDNYKGKNSHLQNKECTASKLVNAIERTLTRAFGDRFDNGVESGSPEYKIQAYNIITKGYYRLVKGLDENIGKLIDFVDSTGLGDKTIIIYTSDNGFFLGEHGLFNKQWMYEESLKIPLIVRYPKEVKAATVSNEFISTLDFAPTLLDYAQTNIPEEFQGHSIRPILKNNIPEDWRSVHFYHYYSQYEVPSHYGIRTNDYKLIHFYDLKENPTWELYDLKNDPGEMTNLYYNSDFIGVKEQLKILLKEKRKEFESIKESDLVSNKIIP